MKTLVIVVGLFAAASAFAQTSTTAVSPAVHSVKQVAPYVERGTPRIAVTVHLGQPTERLSPDVWVYRGFSVERGSVSVKDCGTLVVTFAGGYVSNLQLVNAPAVAAIAAQAKLGPAPHLTAEP
jgi:hypothetical protein